MAPILPGATIGILGGGQLGRMLAMAARPLGYHVHALDPDASCAARFVVERLVAAAFDDDFAAADLARKCQVVTLEIEKVSLPSLDAALRYCPVRPGRAVLEIVQDRGRQRAWLEANGFPQGPFRHAASEAELAAALAALGGKSFVKSCTGGYDGRGQSETTASGDAARAWAELGGSHVVVERALELEAELSVLVARSPSGQLAVYPPALNRQERRILAWSALPGPMPAKAAAEAQAIARDVAAKLEVEGLLVVEFFLTRDGALYVNELAPRPHNSFHATEVGCHVSQFELAVRAVCDLPLPEPEVVRPAAIANLLGDLWLGPTPPDFAGALALPGVRLHLYGKRVPRPGRKMGHLSAIGATPEQAIERVQAASRILAGR